MTTTIAALLHTAQRRLEAAKIPHPRLDATLLLAHATRMSRQQLLMDSTKMLNNNEINDFSAFIDRRCRYEPIAHIIGEKEFWSLDFTVTCDTLVPRPDSETLVEAALRQVRSGINTRQPSHMQAKPLTLLDIGTGTGCLLIALLKELPQARGIGVDNNERALQVAERNARRHGVEARARFVKSHWSDALDGTFDLILSNPPYIAEEAAATLMPDVLEYEPHGALFAGADGLDAYRALAPRLAEKLAEGGLAVLEVGQGQADAVAQLLTRQGLTRLETCNDLAGIARCVIARKSAPIHPPSVN